MRRIESVRRGLLAGTALALLGTSGLWTIPEPAPTPVAVSHGPTAPPAPDLEPESPTRRDAIASPIAEHPARTATTPVAIPPALRAAASSREEVDDGIRELGAALQRQPGDRDGLAFLLGLEALAAQHDLLPTWLEALANTAAPTAHAIAQRHLAHENAPVRAAAITAVLRLAPGQPVADLERLVLGDPEASVRTRAIEALATRRDAAVIDVLARALGSEPEAFARNSILLVLAHHPDRRATAPILARAALADADAGTRELAARLQQRS